eukprot:TRINITY_DN3588_c0_g1_i2.p1 TRINITY_DN3588_c0_g1~~TRINITY_DN3588_c0_g1_i2.p1  ORF type:complete len:794 (+),score=202.44 TRINITY_DN3588_c0_g1_i2:58-2439(+)
MPLIKEKRSKRGRKARVVQGSGGRFTQLISIAGDQNAASNIAQNYLPEYPEMANWDVNVEYSQNKNNRWKIAQSLKDTFSAEDKSGLAEEDINVYAVVVPDPNLVTEYSLASHKDKDVARYFMSSQPDTDIFVGKAKSHVPDHCFDPKKDVKFRMQDEALDKVKNKGYKQNVDYTFMAKTGIKGKQSYYYNEDSGEEEDDFSEEEFEDTVEDSSEDLHSPKQLSLKDFLIQNNIKKGKATRNSSGSKQSPKSFKGKVFFDEDMIQEITLDNQIPSEEFEQVQEFDTTDEKILLFLDDIDPLASKNWETINDIHHERVTMLNKDAGTVLSLQPKLIHDTMIECELKVSSLKDSPADVLPLFTECRSVVEITNMAQQLLGFVYTANKSMQDNCFSPHKAGLTLLDKRVAKYEEEMKNTVISLDDYCNVCFEQGVALDYCACGEGFCQTCWSMYLSSLKEMDKMVLCPGYDCTAPVPISILAWYLPNQKLIELFTNIVQHSVKTDYNVHQCKRAMCKRIVFTDFKSGVVGSNKNLTEEEMGIKCKCGNHWCRWCNQEYHYPSTCQEMQDFGIYVNKLEDWKRLENTVEVRECPKCGTKWEKMWGCNFMHCTKCQVGFCWGCGKEHTNYNGLCGKITIPLEKVEIVPFPTEEFSRSRIESFNLYAQLKKEKLLHIYKKDYDRILRNFLTADRAWFNANFKLNIDDLLQTERGVHVTSVVKLAFTVCKEGCLSLMNSLLKKSTSQQDSKKIRELFFLINNMFHDMLEGKLTERNWESTLRSIEIRSNYFKRRLNLKTE